MKDKRFRTAYVSQYSAHDFTPLLDVCETVKFSSTGYEAEGEVASAIKESLKDYNPSLDLIVPVGSVTINFIFGMVAARMWLSGNFSVAFYKDGEYHITEVTTAPSTSAGKQVEVDDGKSK